MWSFVEIDRQDWSRFWPKVEKANLLQAWAYGRAKAVESQAEPRRFVLKDEQNRPLGLLQVLVKSAPGLGRAARINRGPVFLADVNLPSDQESLLNGTLGAIKALAAEMNWRYVSLAPEFEFSEAAERVLSAAGFIQRRDKPAWASHRLRLDRTEDELFKNLNGKWRNLLRKSMKQELAVRESSPPEALEFVIEKYLEMQGDMNFAGVPPDLIRTLCEPDEGESSVVLFTAATRNSPDPAGYVVMAEHGDGATYFLGWTSAEGRKVCANYLLLWRAVLFCLQKGISWFDLGGLNDETPSGVAHFKKGLNGEPYRLIGEWRWSPNFLVNKVMGKFDGLLRKMP